MKQGPARWGRRGRSGRRGRLGPRGSPGPSGRFGQREQRVAQALSDRSAWAAVDDTATAVSAVANAAWPYAMLVRPQTVTALLAGPTLPWPPAPWQNADRGWLIDRSLLAAAGDDGSARPSDTFVALGSCHGGALLVNLACAPAVISITGDQDAARDLMRSLVAQLQIVPRNRVLVAAGPLFGVPAAPPNRLPDRPSQEASTGDEPAGSWTFFACALPTPADVIRLRARAADAGRTRVLVLGSVVGSRWSLLADANGEVTADGLGLAAWSTPVLRRISERTYASMQVSSPAPRRVPFSAPATPLLEPFSPPPLPAPSAVPPELSTPPLSALPARRSSASPRADPSPRHAKPRTSPRSSPRVAPGERPRPWRRSRTLDDNDDETWLSRIVPVNPFAPAERSFRPVRPVTAYDAAHDRNVGDR
jgi:hypothetical protein